MSALKSSVLMFLTLFAAFGWADENRVQSDIRLVLQLTVDGLRADLLSRGKHRFTEGGFRRMLESWPDRKLFEQVRNNYHPVRSGDIYVVQEPYWFNFDRGPVAGMHGSPWNYDTHVPVIFLGPGIEPQVIHRRVQPADVAPILAALLGMSPPASSQGDVLPEVISH